MRREADPADRRIARVSLTAEGGRTVQRTRTRKTAYLAKRLRKLDESELAVLREALPVLERLLRGRSLSDLPEKGAGRRGPAFLARMFRSLRTRNYRLWFFGQTVSQSGTWMQSVAQYWLVLELTHSAFDLGITAALQFAPVLVFGTVGGLLADRFDKRRLLLVTQTAFTVQAAVLWVLVAERLRASLDGLGAGLGSTASSTSSTTRLARASSWRWPAPMTWPTPSP